MVASGVHRVTTLVFSSCLAILGSVMIVLTILNGGGVFARGIVLGAIFLLAGALRFWLVFTGQKKAGKG